MSMAHGSWCNSVTWPTKCSQCDQRVFFFRCDCGSRVFFDKLGAPWPIHDCETSWARDLRRWQDDFGWINVEISSGITVRRAPEGSIDHTIVPRAKRRESRPDPIVAIKPEGSEKITIVGILREKRMEVDVTFTLKLPETSIVAGFLGELAEGKWGKFTIHTQPPNEDVLHSYTAWAPSAALSHANNSQGVTVEVQISSKSIPGVDNFWVCSHYNVLG